MAAISIVTPSFNQAKYLEEALDSVQRQGYQQVEHIVVDGASKDRTVEILKQLSGERGWEHLRWISEPDEGQSDALNKGFHQVTGGIVGWLNADDRYRAGCFEAVVDTFRKYPDVDIVYGDYTWINEGGHVWQVRREIEFSLFILQYHRVLYIPSTATFFRRRVFDEGNFIDTQFHYAMDYEFFLRLARKGYRFKRIPHLLADFRWHPQSKSGSAECKQLQEHDRIAQMYSPLIRNMSDGLPKKLAFGTLRLAAAGARYTKKLFRGHYFDQFRPKP